jgi:hypothetical protein
MAEKKAKRVSMAKLESLIDEGWFPIVQFGYTSKGKKYTYGGLIVAADDSAGNLTMKRRSHLTGEIGYRTCNIENILSDIFMVDCKNNDRDENL